MRSAGSRPAWATTRIPPTPPEPVARQASWQRHAGGNGSPASRWLMAGQRGGGLRAGRHQAGWCLGCADVLWFQSGTQRWQVMTGVQAMGMARPAPMAGSRLIVEFQRLLQLLRTLRRLPVVRPAACPMLSSRRHCAAAVTRKRGKGRKTSLQAQRSPWLERCNSCTCRRGLRHRQSIPDWHVRFPPQCADFDPPPCAFIPRFCPTKDGMGTIGASALSFIGRSP